MQCGSPIKELEDDNMGGFPVRPAVDNSPINTFQEKSIRCLCPIASIGYSSRMKEGINSRLLLKDKSDTCPTFGLFSGNAHEKY